MSLSIGIVGLPNVGKSTLYNALTKAQNAQAANYPFCTIEPNKASVAVPDPRLDVLARLTRPHKVVYATVDFVDIAGLVRGASTGEGLGNQFLGHIRQCAALVHVVRCFDDPNIAHVDGAVDPLRDVETIETELLLADIQAVEKRLERLRKIRGDKDAKALADMVDTLLTHLNGGAPASTFALPPVGAGDAAAHIWREMGLITAQKTIYCANIDENAALDGNEYVEKVRRLAKSRKAGFAVMCAKIEEELQGLPEAEQAELLASYGFTESGLTRIARTGYHALGLISYFTVGPKEARAWTIRQGYKAPQAAGVIHSDFERGFIRAEVVGFEDFATHTTEAACRAAGIMRTEGKEYIVRDGDVIHYLFNV